MPWTAKPGAPVSFNLAGALQSIITGDANWAWLLAYLPWMGDPFIVTDELCAAGPPETPEISLALFAGAGFNPLDRVLIPINIGNVLGQWAFGRTFAAYCENIVAANDDCIASGAHPDPGNPDWWFAHFPVGANRLVIGDGDGGRMQDAYWTLGDASYSFQRGAISNAGGGGTQVITNTDQGAETWVAFRMNSNVPSYVQLCGSAGGTVEHDPGTPVEPAGLVPPTTRDYSSIADLGAELDRQEHKLDQLVNYVSFLTAHTVLPGAPGVDELPIELAEDEELAVADAIGAIITLSSIPPWASANFGSPPKLSRIGYVSIGTADAWQAPIRIEVTPQLVAFPPGTTRCKVSTGPQLAASVTLLRPPK